MTRLSDLLSVGETNGTALRAAHVRVAERARTNPATTAVIAGGTRLTFGELDNRANQLAAALSAAGVGRRDLVGVCVERDADMAVALLGILKSGAGYVPVDPAYPADRAAFMLRDANVRAVVTQQSLAHRAELHGRTLLLMDGVDEFADAPLDVEVAADDVAYVIYTSGSTGQPKGVIITHGNLSHYLDALPPALGIAAADVYLHTASVAFSSSVRQLFVPLSLGATSVIASRAMIEDPIALFGEIRRSGVTVIDLVPSYWRVCNQALKAAGEGRSELLDNALRLIVSASEPLPRDVVESWRENMPHVPAINMFGQTETTGIVATYPIPSDLSGHGPIVPVGRAIAGMTLLVLDAEGNPVEVGEPGQVVVAGPGVGRGYINREDLTAERFSAENGVTLYHTGDRGRIGANGALEFLGRGDDQVKIRGHRVEIAEIESVLHRVPGVLECVVRAQQSAAGEQRLAAWVVADGSQPLTATSLRQQLQQTLPSYMVPSLFYAADRLPRTATGKLNRDALQATDATPRLAGPEFVAPRTPTEDRVATIVASVLETSAIGVHDDFLDVGGNSLMTYRVATRLRQELGVMLPLRTMLTERTVAQIATHVDSALQQSVAAVVTAIERIERSAEIPLSTAQQRLWLVMKLDPTSTAYHLSAAMRITGALEVAALQHALNEIVRRHESLRTVFPERDGTPTQLVMTSAWVDLPIVEVPAGAADPAAAALQLATAATREPFDLATGPLFRATLVRTSESEHLLALSYHHIVADGWSRGLLYRELGALYADFAVASPATLPAPSIQYIDFSEWQRAWLQSGVLEPQLEYWREQLADGPAPLELPVDRARPPVQSHYGATHWFDVPAAVANPLRAFGTGEDATMFMTLLAGFKALLHRYSGETDIAVGSPVLGRNRVELEPLIGLFVNTLVLRTALAGEPTFRELLGRVKETAHGAFANQDVPFERLVDELGATRDPSRSPLFQVMFILQNTPNRALQLSGTRLENVELDLGAAKFDLTLSLVARDAGFSGALEYNTDLFDATTAERMAQHYIALLEALAAAPDAPITALPLQTAGEAAELQAFNATGGAFPSACVHEQFEAQVARTPDATALIFEDKSLTYRELNERANQLAHHLRRVGVGPDTIIGICVPRSLEMMVALLGVLKAGGAYLPLDPGYPRDRIAGMIEDSGALLLITTSQLASQLPAEGTRLLLIDGQDALFDDESIANVATTVTPSDLAYMIYTSGSTGRPKGVMVEHRNVSNFFKGMDERLGTEPGTWLAVTSISFDISVLELFWTLTRGFRVVIQSEEAVLGGGSDVPAYRNRSLDFGLFYFAADASAQGAAKYRMLMEGARYADDNGFASVWTPERHFHAFGGLYPNPSVTSAAVAAITKNVAIRAGSVVLPLHHPLRVAEEWAVVDNLSNGRVGIAFASGWHDRDFVFAPDNYAARRDVMFNGIETVRALWRGQAMECVTGAGKPTQVTVLPRPVQAELPIWVTAAGTPDTFRTAGEIGANILTHLLGQTPEQLAERIALYRQARRDAGHDGPGYVSLMLHTFVGEDVESVRAKVYHPFREYLRTSVALIKELAEGRGQDLRAASFTKEDMESLLDHAFERYWKTSALLGTVDSCMELVDSLKKSGIDEVACLIDFGVDTESVLASLPLLRELKERANAVIPAGAPDYSLGTQIRRHGVTHLQSTPSLAGMLLTQETARDAFAALRTICIGGEAFPTSLASELRQVTKARVINMYGPTETTIWSSTHTLDGTATSSIPLGRPIANTELYVLDERLQPVPMGVPGELFIAGAGVVRGYYNRPELTAERFVADPFRGGNSRMYRTGDLVRFRNGQLEFLGRTDFQVKVLGHRIELGEIESVLAWVQGVREAVVAVREDSPGDKRLVAYLVPRTGATIDVAAARQLARERLPEFMVPAHFVVLADLPRTPNAKVDRKRLPAPDLSAAQATGVDEAPPANELERQILEIWQEVLRVQRVGSTANFFDLGGNSFLAVRVHARLRAALNTEMPLMTLFRFPTARALAAHLGGTEAETKQTNVADAGADRAEQRRNALRRRRQPQ